MILIRMIFPLHLVKAVYQIRSLYQSPNVVIMLPIWVSDWQSKWEQISGHLYFTGTFIIYLDDTKLRWKRLKETGHLSENGKKYSRHNHKKHRGSAVLRKKTGLQISWVYEEQNRGDWEKLEEIFAWCCTCMTVLQLGYY